MVASAPFDVRLSVCVSRPPTSSTTIIGDNEVPIKGAYSRSRIFMQTPQDVVLAFMLHEPLRVILEYQPCFYCRIVHAYFGEPPF